MLCYYAASAHACILYEAGFMRGLSLLTHPCYLGYKGAVGYMLRNIPDSLIINLDQTGVKLVPTGDWTMAAEGSKRVEVAGLGDKRQITATFTASLDGTFLPMQILLYQGKTERSHPKHPFPDAATKQQKEFLREKIRQWYAKEVEKQFQAGVVESGVKVNMGMRVMKEVGDQHCMTNLALRRALSSMGTRTLESWKQFKMQENNLTCTSTKKRLTVIAVYLQN